MDFELLTVDQLKQIVDFGERRSEKPRGIPDELLQPPFFSRAFNALEELGVIGFHQDSHYDGCSC